MLFLFTIERRAEMCGIFGISNGSVRGSYWGIRALQHRGQESAGIAVYNEGRIKCHKAMGLVEQVFPEQVLQGLSGSISIAQTRYSTAGESDECNAQPLVLDSKFGPLAVAHNGNFVKKIRQELTEDGVVFQSTTDTEIILHLLERSEKSSFVDALLEVLQIVGPAYSLVMMCGEMLIGARDPYGFRPLCLGKLNASYILSSETTALERIQASYIREVQAGEVVVIQDRHLVPYQISPVSVRAKCIFEHVYFSRPDSRVFERVVQSSRYRMGKGLAQEHPAEADLVVPVPDSGVPAAVGYSNRSGIPLCLALIRDQYVGRSFIEPAQKVRDSIADVKITVIRELVRNKRVILIDDSVVRATTILRIVEKLFDAGAREVHLRVSCPPTISPCFYGVDTPTKRELIASRLDVEGIRQFIGVNSLGYLSLPGLLKAVRSGTEEFCTACYTGKYSTELTPEILAELQT
jgi:amidophosphoribosyltransferase